MHYIFFSFGALLNTSLELKGQIYQESKIFISKTTGDEEFKFPSLNLRVWFPKYFKFEKVKNKY